MSPTSPAPAPPRPASLRHDAAVALATALSFALAAAVAFSDPLAGLAALVPQNVAAALALPVALSCLRGRRRVAGLAYLAAALAMPLLSYWARFPFQLGEMPSPGHVDPADLLAGLPCAAFGLLLLSRPRAATGVPGPSVLLDALQAVVAGCVVALLASAAARGGQFGVGYFLASLALMGGLFKGALVQGAVSAAAAMVIARDGRPGIPLASAGAFSVLAASAAWSAGSGAGAAWCAGFALAVLSRLSRGLRPLRRPTPAPASAPSSA